MSEPKIGEVRFDFLFAQSSSHTRHSTPEGAVEAGHVFCSEIVFDSVSPIYTSSFRLLDYLLKVSPLRIIEQVLNVAGLPEIVSSSR